MQQITVNIIGMNRADREIKCSGISVLYDFEGL